MFKEGHEKIGGRKQGSTNGLHRDIKHVIDVLINAVDDNALKLMTKDLLERKPEAILSFLAKIAPKDYNVTAVKRIEDMTLEELKQILEDMQSDKRNCIETDNK